MGTLDNWVERIYGETDFGRSIATSVAGIVGLVVYLAVHDWVISAFSAIIAFPVARLLSAGLYERAHKATKQRVERESAINSFRKLSESERRVVSAFVQAGGSVLTWSQANSLSLPGPAIESLIQRGLITTSMTADGMRETFVLEPAVFDVGSREMANSGAF
jgi:hypothetical protein